MKKTVIKAPITTQLEITGNCNLRCPHCYHFDNSGNSDYFITKSENEKIMEITKKLVQLQVFDVVITGGEPLVNKELVLRLVEYLGKNNIGVSINTNLTLLTEDFLQDPRLSYLRGFLVSCPSCDKDLYKIMTGNGNYEIFEKNLILLKEKGFRFSVNMVVNRKNLSDIRNTAQHLSGLGIKRFGATPMALNLLCPDFVNFLKSEEVIQLIRDLVWINDNLGMSVDIFEAIPKCIFPEDVLKKDFNFLKRKCLAGITSMAVSNNGDIRPCTHNIDNYGNILTEDFPLIWEKMNDWKRKLYLPEECHTCQAMDLCTGGCRMTAKGFSKLGDRKAKDPWMIGPLANKIQMSSKEITLFPEMTVKLNGTVQYREEDGTYLIGTKDKNNVIRGNQSLFEFIIYLQKIEKSTLIELAGDNNTFESRKFQKIIKFLLNKKILIGGKNAD